MARHFKFCAFCRRTITGKELERGLYVESDEGLICATCAQKLDEPEIAETVRTEPDPASYDIAPVEAEIVEDPPPTPTAQAAPSDRETVQKLQEIQDQLERVYRAILFEKSSSWNVLAAVAQSLAICMLVAAGFRWLTDPVPLLLVALVFQIMALTCFVKGK